MASKILITGSSGFLGKALGAHLSRKSLKNKVYKLSRRSHPNHFQCDLNHNQKLKAFLERIRPDYIINLAGGRFFNTQKMVSGNISATESLLKVVNEISSYNPRIVIVGSAAEYGLPLGAGKKVREADKCMPLSEYGKVKLQQTKLALRYAKKGVDVCVVRIFNVCGTGIPPEMVIGKFAKEIVSFEKEKSIPAILKTYNLKGFRDFIDVKDVCEGLILVAKKGKRGEIYNICSGEKIGVQEALNKMLSYSTRKDICICEDISKGQMSCSVIGSNQKIKKELGWKIRVSIEKSLKESLTFYRGQKR